MPTYIYYLAAGYIALDEEEEEEEKEEEDETHKSLAFINNVLISSHDLPSSHLVINLNFL